jgi:hypothetical protein
MGKISSEYSISMRLNPSYESTFKAMESKVSAWENLLEKSFATTLSGTDKTRLAGRFKTLETELQGVYNRENNRLIAEAGETMEKINAKIAPTNQDSLLIPLMAGKTKDEMLAKSAYSDSLKRLLASDSGVVLGIGDQERQALKKSLAGELFEKHESIKSAFDSLQRMYTKHNAELLQQSDKLKPSQQDIDFSRESGIYFYGG